MNRIDRLQAILTQLQSKRIVKAQEIADRFEISLRTVYRDIRALEEGGVPIGAEAGIGYYLMEGYHLPPVMFSNTEAHALLLGAKLIENMADQSVDTAFQSALYKIKSVLKTNSKDSLEDLDQRIKVVSSTRTAPQTFDSHFLSDIQQALAQHQTLTIEYFSSYNTKLTERTVEPVGLLYYNSDWHMIAYCLLRNDYRDFRVDRIKSLKFSKTFKSRSSDTLQNYLDNLARTEHLEEAVIIFDKEILRYAAPQRYGYGFVSEEDLGNQVRMRFLVGSTMGMAHWLLMYTNAVTIESPFGLKEAVQKLVIELQGHYFAESQPIIANE
ncbi:YafY family protein [Cytophagaceae bacterium DM2B3-1]|uniref:YafY family protein n=1 Tax=Xanthocytophaga flava TaxID=3048013 RepID=A0ABT7CQF5_9BACT|nr:YafY family protein [Xanthocytophaga flavus]MDJ1468079.1 YafY family protein [Xanthocytophaga flavus]MDJ1495975.1 YafY family protein [Xanthocytophaga flavus]